MRRDLRKAIPRDRVGLSGLRLDFRKEIMKTGFKSKWLKALRSGKYKQAKGRLRKKLNGHYGYCCLGVLYKEINKEWPKVTRSIGVGYLPKKFSEEMKLSRSKQGDLAIMNDGGQSFSQIADWIEKNVSGRD